MAKSYRSAQGKTIDMESLRLQNELVPAVGNMRVNARGDQLGPGGKIVKSREQMLDDHYNSNIRRTRDDDGSDEIPTSGGKARKVEKVAQAEPMVEVDIFDDDEPEPVVVQEEIPAPVVQAPKPAPRKRVTKKKAQPAPEPVAASVTEEVTITQEPTVEPAPTRIASNEFEFTGDTEESVTKDPILPADPMTGFSKGGKALKGGLAKAVAKTKAYEEQKNPGPKRM
jgi:hypothetical protein